LIQPVATVAWGMILLGEWLGTLQWAGVVLVLLSVGYLTLRGAVEPAVRAPSEP
jgi:drug/metabolite transporter (DMT)-like permease